MVEAKDPNRATSGDLEKMSIIIPHPIAHISRDDDLLNNFNATHRRNTQVVKDSLGLALPSAKAKLAEAGWKVDKVILFDGFPQHFHLKQVVGQKKSKAALMMCVVMSMIFGM